MCCRIPCRAICRQNRNISSRLKPLNAESEKKTAASTLDTSVNTDISPPPTRLGKKDHKQRQSIRRYGETCSVLRRATSSPTSAALIFIPPLSLSRVSSHLTIPGAVFWVVPLVSAAPAEPLEDVLTRRRRGDSRDDGDLVRLSIRSHARVFTCDFWVDLSLFVLKMNLFIWSPRTCITAGYLYSIDEFHKHFTMPTGTCLGGHRVTQQHIVRSLSPRWKQEIPHTVFLRKMAKRTFVYKVVEMAALSLSLPELRVW